jgi:hypothetical protein
LLIAEAQWIAAALDRLPDDAFPLVNLGSSTADFRENDQPWIEDTIFRPLRERGRQVFHVDIKEAPGVDVVADATQPQGQAAIRALGAGTILCANLLEHVPDAGAMCQTLLELSPEAGYLILTVPRRYPHHPDPVDTMFRPSPADLERLLGEGTETIAAAEVSCRRLAFYYSGGSAGLPRLVLRMAVPFYRPRRWIELVRWAWRRPLQTCLLARRTSSPSGSTASAHESSGHASNKER